MTLPLRVQTGKHDYAARGNDLYETPACAVRALLEVETLPDGAVWEPACGPGAIARVLRQAGHPVWATDLVDYQSPDQDHAGMDFLAQTGSAPCYFGSIVTNPPYKLAHQFALHAVVLCPRVYMLLRLSFLESERRSEILENGWLARVHVFRKRLPMMHRAGWAGPRITSNAIPFAWFVWDRAHVGATELRRISA